MYIHVYSQISTAATKIFVVPKARAPKFVGNSEKGWFRSEEEIIKDRVGSREISKKHANIY